MTACTSCSKHGKLVWEEEPKPETVMEQKRLKQPLKVLAKKPPEAPVDTAVELEEGFSAKIRQAREKLGLSHEDLGKKMNEKVSFLRKIETGKMTPDNVLATKLERALKIKLIVPASGEPVKIPPASLAKRASRELTLGDLVQLSKKGKGETAERELS